MKFSKNALTFLLLVSGGCDAFTVSTKSSSFGGVTNSRSNTARSMAIDPSAFHMDSITNAFSLLADVSAVTDGAAPAVTSAAADAAATAAAVAEPATTAASTSGPFGFLTTPIENLLLLINSVVGSWGVSIIMMTVIIKLLTFPLTKTQLESTNKMQALQPTIKEIQAKYQSNPDVMNQKIAEVYQTNEVNPLAGCLPSLVQIPIFIGLYRAILTLSQENQLNEPFGFLPNLEGPTYGADAAHGSDWILKGWVDGTPSLGWDDTLAFLALPVFLVVSQFVSMQIMQPKNQTPEQQQSNFILKLLPVMIGWFSLNVPAALCIYWVSNNIITTATTLIVRNSMPEPVGVGGGGSTTATTTTASTAQFTPPPIREKPAGFAETTSFSSSGDDMKPITVVDAEIEEVSSDDVESSGEGMSEGASKRKKSRGSKKKKKRRN